jgi:hypothetical protein
MSRTLTPDEEFTDKVGRVISLSFDPNRDDKFDAMIMETANNYQKKHGVSFAKALKVVVNTMDIFSCSKSGRVKIDNDVYLHQLMASRRLSRHIGQMADFSNASSDMLKAFAASDLKAFELARQEVAKKGKTFDALQTKNTKGKSVFDIDKNLLERARNAITAIVENMDIIILGANSRTLDEAFITLRKDKALSAAVESRIGVSVPLIEKAIDCGIINKSLLSINESFITC